MDYQLLIGWLLDKCWGDPSWLPHPVVYFGKAIACGERRLNHGAHRRMKGGMLAVALILLTFFLTAFIIGDIGLLGSWIPSDHPVVTISRYILSCILVFFCLAGTTLIKEVRMVFEALDRSLEEGRRQVARIVGRDTSQLNAQEIRQAALETLAENLSDGVVAPLFWFLLLGVPGMMTYKMINTLDSMIGYRTERYRLFGTVAARIDDVANYLPARLTALLMILVAGRPRLITFVGQYGKRHASPNSGYPESALAGILDCQFGGTHTYFGEVIEKPFIGNHPRTLDSRDMQRACAINSRTEFVMVMVVFAIINLL